MLVESSARLRAALAGLGMRFGRAAPPASSLTVTLEVSYAPLVHCAYDGDVRWVTVKRPGGPKTRGPVDGAARQALADLVQAVCPEEWAVVRLVPLLLGMLEVAASDNMLEVLRADRVHVPETGPTKIERVYECMHDCDPGC